MALGETLRKARMARKETASQVAAATRMKVQLVEALEKEDFSQIPAPIYAKGFIKLYAEHVGLDPEPLVRDYLQIRATPDAPPKKSKRAATPKASVSSSANRLDPSSDLFSRAGIAVPGDSATPENMKTEDDPPSKSRSAYRREPDKNVLSSDLERYSASRAQAPQEPNPPAKPIGAARQALETGLLALRHALDRLSASQAAMREYFSDISLAHPIRSPGKFAVMLVGSLIIAILILSGLSRHLRDKASPQPRDSGLVLVADAPEPYFD